jgi:hypothetical protein
MIDSEDDDFLDLGQFYSDDQNDDTWEESKHDLVEEVVERYGNSELIATGGMKDIYKVYDAKTCRHIAMAQLRTDVAEEQCESFLKEAYLTASMEHPNIISVYDIGLKDQHEPYFTMELKVGDSLADLMKKDQVSLNGLLENFVKICDAISYAHSCGNLHLDIKPDNIQVGTFGEVQVCDWGLGSHIDEMAKSENGLIKGTPGYMSPEQGKPGSTIDKQTDIYALGALLYSILTGKTPVAGGVNTVISKTVNGRLKFPAERFPDKKIPESLDAVVRKAMSFEKKERYQSVDQLKDEVNNFLTGHSTEAENAGFMKEFSLFFQRNKQVCLVVLSAIFLIGLGSAAFLFKIQESKNATENALTDLKQSHEELKISREKERIAFETSEENFKKYVEQREEQKKVSKELHMKQVETAYATALYPIYFADPVGSMSVALEMLKLEYNNSGNINLAQHIIKNLFITQNFKEIRHYEASSAKPLAELAKTYRTLRRVKGGELKDSDFLKVLRDLNGLPEEFREFRYSMIERMIFYQMALKKTDFTSPEVLVELIKCWNPEWDESKMSYDPKKLHFKITGEKIKKMIATAKHSSKQCFFRLLKVDSLDISGTNVQNMHQFIGLNVKTLNIQNTAIKVLIPHSAVKGVVKLIVSEGQFTKDEMRRAPKALKITEVE